MTLMYLIAENKFIRNCL